MILTVLQHCQVDIVDQGNERLKSAIPDRDLGIGSQNRFTSSHGQAHDLSRQVARSNNQARLTIC